MILAFVGIGHYQGHCVSQTHLVFSCFYEGKTKLKYFCQFFFLMCWFLHVHNICFLKCQLKLWDYKILTRKFQLCFVHTKALLIIIRLVIRQLILNPVKIWSWSWSLWFVFFLTDCVFQHSPPVPCGVCHGLPTILQWGQQNPPLSQITTPVPPYGISTDISDLCDIDRIPPVLWNKSYDSWASSDWVHICWNLLLLCSLNLS